MVLVFVWLGLFGVLQVFLLNLPSFCHALSPSHTFCLHMHSSKKLRNPILLSLRISSTLFYLTSQGSKRGQGILNFITYVQITQFSQVIAVCLKLTDEPDQFQSSVSDNTSFTCSLHKYTLIHIQLSEVHSLTYFSLCSLNNTFSRALSKELKVQSPPIVYTLPALDVGCLVNALSDKSLPFALNSPLELKMALFTEQVCKLEKNFSKKSHICFPL